ncbi:hypothetical protein ACFL6Z_12530 [Pseudomonadota bacterium]
MKKLILSASLLLIISGCSTTPGEMRTNTPHVLEYSDKAAKSITICIADKWGQSGVVNQRESSDGYSLTFTSNGKLLYLADIEKNGDKTVTKVYKYLQYLSDPNQMLIAAKECQI